MEIVAVLRLVAKMRFTLEFFTSHRTSRFARRLQQGGRVALPPIEKSPFWRHALASRTVVIAAEAAIHELHGHCGVIEENWPCDWFATSHATQYVLMGS